MNDLSRHHATVTSPWRLCPEADAEARRLTCTCRDEAEHAAQVGEAVRRYDHAHLVAEFRRWIRGRFRRG
jgi:hypothetical protein